MGYEVIFHYHKREENGEYNKDQTETMKRRIGKAEDEIQVKHLAGTIMSQLARRDVWVVGVEIYEFTKKKVSFKEVKNGLVIGNRKYSFDDCGGLGVQELVEAPVAMCSNPDKPPFNPFKPAFHAQNLPAIPEEALQGGSVNVADLALLKKKPIRYEVFQPDPAFGLPTRGLDFTVGDKYPIYSERAAGNDNRLGMNYTTVDNQGRKQVLNDKYFVPAGSLVGGDQFNERRDVALNYGDDGGFGMQMPKLR